MEKIIIGEQLDFGSCCISPAICENDIFSEVYSKLHHAKENDYKLPKELYEQIMDGDMHPNVYSVLINGARSFNLTYDRLYKNSDFVSRIDTIGVFKKVLSSKNILFIGLCLTNLRYDMLECVEKYKKEATYVYDTCVNLAFDFLKKLNDDDMIREFLCFSEVDWNNEFSFLCEFVQRVNLSDKVLWDRLIKPKLLNKENMSILLKEKTLLMLMYLINCDTNFDNSDKTKIRTLFRYTQMTDEVRAIDNGFYEKKIKRMVKGKFKPHENKLKWEHYEKSIKDMMNWYVDDDNAGLQMSFFKTDANDGSKVKTLTDKNE